MHRRRKLAYLTWVLIRRALLWGFVLFVLSAASHQSLVLAWTPARTSLQTEADTPLPVVVAEVQLAGPQAGEFLTVNPATIHWQPGQVATSTPGPPQPTSQTPAPASMPTATPLQPLGGEPPANAYRPVGVFADLWAKDFRLQHRLGWAKTAYSASTAAAFLPFEHGVMIWRADEEKIYVLYNDGLSLLVLADTFKEGERESGPSLVPPPGKWQPSRGFGKVWRENPTLQERLGWAIAQEEGYTLQWQRFEHGLLLNHGPDIYVLEDDGGFGTPTWSKQLPEAMLVYLVKQGQQRQLVFRTLDSQTRRTLALPPALSTVPPTSLAPSGQWLAFYTGAVSLPDKPAADDLTLHLLNLQDGQVLTITRLLPPDFPQNLQRNAQLLAQRIPDVAHDPQLVEGIWLAFAEALHVHAWSPDGRYLAFAGAMDGPSSDLYLYDTTNRQITRLTDGPEQLVGIRWSPDGTWIWHDTVSVGFCEGCYGHHYAAAVDGSTIYTIPGDEGDRFITWLGPQQYLETSGANGIGDFGLHLVDLMDKKGKLYWAGSYRAFVLDWTHQQLLIDGSPERSPMPKQKGIYLVNLTTGKFTSIPVAQQKGGLFPWLAQAGRLPCGQLAGRLVYPCSEQPLFTAFSPNGQWWIKPNLDLYHQQGGLQLRATTHVTATQLIWRPDSAGFYYIAGGGLYYRPLLGTKPVLVEARVDSLIWAGTTQP